MSTRAHEHSKTERAKPLLRVGLPPAVHAAIQRRTAELSETSGRRVDEFETIGRLLGCGLQSDVSALLQAPDLRFGLRAEPSSSPEPVKGPPRATNDAPKADGDPWGLLGDKPVEFQPAPKQKAPPKASKAAGKTKERTAEEKSAFKKIVDHYFVTFKAARNNVEPVFTGKEAAAVYRLLDNVGLDRALQAITNAFADKFTRGTASILKIAADASVHLGKQGSAETSFQTKPAESNSWNRAREVRS